MLSFYIQIGLKVLLYPRSSLLLFINLYIFVTYFTRSSTTQTIHFYSKFFMYNVKNKFQILLLLTKYVLYKLSKIYSFNQCSLTTYYRLRGVLSASNLLVNKSIINCCSYFNGRQTIIRCINKIYSTLYYDKC